MQIPASRLTVTALIHYPVVLNQILTMLLSWVTMVPDPEFPPLKKFTWNMQGFASEGVNCELIVGELDATEVALRED